MMNTEIIHALIVGITLNLRRERMSNHTPGPWFIQLPPLRSYTDLHIYAKYTEKEEAKFPGSSGKFIATVRKYDVHTQEANARLIASAPDLLEVCEMAYEYINEMTIDEIKEHSELNLIKHCLDLAIQKAKGVELGEKRQKSNA
jgi:hypothetical protein